MGLGSLQSSRFLELGFRMLTEGEPPEKVGRFSNTIPPPFPPDTTASTTPSSTLNRGRHPSTSEQDPTPDMPAFPDRVRPPSLISASMLIAEQRNGGDLEGSRASPEGSVCLSGSEGNYGRESSFCRKQREFIPDSRKDEMYWEKRRKNNEAARRSREKRRLHDMLLENRIMDLEQDNSRLRTELHSLKKRYGVPLDTVFLDNQNGSTECERNSPSPPDTKPQGCPVNGDSVGATPGLGYADHHPPLPMAVGGVPVSMQQVTMPGMFPQQASHRPYFNGAVPSHNAHFTQTKQEARPQSLAGYNCTSDMPMAKRKAQEDMVGMRTPSMKLDNYREEGVSENGGMYLQYGGVPSPSSVGRMASSAAVAPAAGPQYSSVPGPGALPPRQTYDHYTSQPWRRSPLSSHSSDETLDEPLQLTVHKRSSEEDSRDGDSGREGMSADASMSRCNGWTSSPPHPSLPLKFRHKISSELSPPHASYPRPLSMGASHFGNGFAQLPDLGLTQISPLSLVKKEEGMGSSISAGTRRGSNGRNPIDLKHLDPKYLERRRRNNEAARKCRENRRNMTRLREAKSDYLESENGKLRKELEALQEEMKQLRDLLDRKRLEQGQDQEVSQQQMAFSEEQTKRLQQLEEEHRLLQEEQQQLEQRREQHRQDMQNGDLDDSEDLKDTD